MWSEFWKQIRHETITRITSFGRDVGSVFQALGAWGIVFLLVNIVLGALPLIVVFTLGSTVDAMIGARGIGVVTSDVNHQLTRWLVLLLVAFAAYLFTVRFTGKAGEVGRGLRDIVIFSSLLIYYLTINQIFLAFAFTVVIAVDLVFLRYMLARTLGLLTTLLVGSLIVHTLVRYTVLRSFTVGEGVTMIAAIVTFVIFIKIRIARA